MKKFENFSSNLDVLLQADKEDLDNGFIISGIIDKFSLQFEFGWKVLKEYIPAFQHMEEEIREYRRSI